MTRERSIALGNRKENNLIRAIRIYWRNFTRKLTRIGSDVDDTADTRLQKTLLISGCTFVMVAATIWGVAYILMNEPIAGWISLFYSIFSFLSIWIFRLTRNFRLFRSSQLILGLLLPFLHTLALGGLLNSSVVILWGMIIPLGALLLFEPHKAIPWWIAYIFLVILSGLLQPFLRTTNNLPLAFINSFLILNISVVFSIFIFTLYYFINQKNKAYRMLRVEEEKAENLLLNILPKEIAAILKNENRTIAEQFEGTSVLFADLVGFTRLTAQMAPVEMVNLLNEIFTHFDSLVEKCGVEKIRTIGDNYMVASGAPSPRPDHALVLAQLALEMTDYLKNRPAENGVKVEFRIGINSGPVVGGVIGRKKFVYDIWGDAVNIASRMESQGVPGRIQITRATYELIKERFVCEPRGTIPIKGKGEMETWYLVGVKP